MTTIEVNSFVRMLSTVYVYFWIPIRLNYLRLKIKIRPVLNVFVELFAIMALVLTGVPASIIYILAKGIEDLIELWVTSLCNRIESTTGINSEVLRDSVLSSVSLIEEPSVDVEESVNEPEEQQEELSKNIKECDE